LHEETPDRHRQLEELVDEPNLPLKADRVAKYFPVQGNRTPSVASFFWLIDKKLLKMMAKSYRCASQYRADLA
jgi:hypothetical protein